MKRRVLSAAVLALVGAACNAGPEPKQASDVSPVPIHNTAAVVENIHAVTDVDPSPGVLHLLNDADRDPRDRALDARYQAAELLTFLEVPSGGRIAELAAGGGYFTELLARSVGPQGRIFANEPPDLTRGTPASAALSDRLTRPVNANVVRSDRGLASPLPNEARDLDAVYLSLPYRTGVRLGVDMKALDQSAFAALKGGGRFIVLDYRPRLPGPSRVNLHALHAEESTSVRRQIEAAGFQFLTEGRFLRNDPRPSEWDAILADEPTSLEEQDRFLLEFIKPR